MLAWLVVVAEPSDVGHYKMPSSQSGSGGKDEELCLLCVCVGQRESRRDTTLDGVKGFLLPKGIQ